MNGLPVCDRYPLSNLPAIEMIVLVMSAERVEVLCVCVTAASEDAPVSGGASVSTPHLQ